MPHEQLILVQLSDPHIGLELVNEHFKPHGTFREGYNPHDDLLCSAMQNALLDAEIITDLADGEWFYLLVTGDLTLMGTRGDFALAETFLHGQLPIAGGVGPSFGLGVPRDRVLSVPGNHDHRNGGIFPPRAYNPHVFRSWFRDTPWKETLSTLGGGLEVEVLGVDTNVGLAGRFANLRAWGELTDAELQRLADLCHSPPGLVNDGDTLRLRVLLAHHALYHPRPYGDAQPLSSESTEKLRAAAVDHGVTAVLTGHQHDFDARGWIAPGGDPAGQFWELRCGTPTQGPATPAHQGFYVHQIRREESQARWTVWRFLWDGDHFQPPAGAQPSSYEPLLEFTVA